MKKKQAKSGKQGAMIPRSILTQALKDAIHTKGDERIEQLSDVIYSSITFRGDHEEQLRDHDRRLDQQHNDIVSAIQSMHDGFARMDKRFEQVDKRFEQVDKRFEHVENRLENLSRRMFQFMIWTFGFVASSTGIIIAVLKF
ncbi:MAG: hypothetical protein ACOCX9_09550 [Spirochaetota bacterium]